MNCVNIRMHSTTIKITCILFDRQLVMVVLVECLGHMQLMSHTVATSATLT